ncbi:MAG: hypothetical protein GF392_05580 [Candidatus Omnitrophica bacterium]|nr:hypothetical protein [Candidatus Omnitrophota bacterium]
MGEKRKRARRGKYFAVNIISVDADGKVMHFDEYRSNPKFCDESGVDFSPEGVKIMCSKPLPEESAIQMKMMIPDESGLNLIKANGTIKWFRQVKGRYKKYFNIGVHFRDLSEKDRDKLMNLWRKYSEE